MRSHFASSRVIACICIWGLGAAVGAQTDHPAGIANWSSPATWTAPAHRGSHALAIESDIGGPLPFVPVTPCRIVDTRGPVGTFGGPSLPASAPRNFPLPTGPCAGIPASVSAYSLNITVTNTQGSGFIKIYPQGGPAPVVSTLNYLAGQTLANAAIVPAGTSGGVTVVAGVSGTDLIIDINGYYVSTLNGNEQLLVTASFSSGAIRGVNSSGDGVQGQTSSLGSSGVYGNNTGGGKGVFGSSTSGNGVEGQSTSGSGVQGESNTGSGLYGRTAGSSGASGAAGVWGDTHDYFGVWGTSVAADGVHGQTAASTASGVAGFNTSSGAGIFGSSASGDGVFGGGSTGVHGSSTFGWGVYGHSQASDGVHADTPSNNSAGVAGINTANGYGVFGSTNLGNGVFGQAVGTTGSPDGNGAGVHAFGTANCSFSAFTGYVCTDGTYALFSEGPAKFSNGVYVAGPFYAAGAKSFVTPHPTDPTKQIAFVSLEGPESGTYFRGTAHLVGSYAEIPIPESFRLVTSPIGLSVVVSPVGQLATLAVISRSLDKITVQGSADVDFDYVVNGVRAGFENFQVIQNNYLFVPSSAADRSLVQLPAEAVRRLKANGTLNDDGSINEETAQRLGWDQRPGWNRDASR